ncbi:hypothetical protein K420107F6_35510 [Lactonifactor longoviformis]
MVYDEKRKKYKKKYWKGRNLSGGNSAAAMDVCSAALDVLFFHLREERTVDGGACGLA